MRAGQLVVATPVLTDPSFARTVVLLLQADEEDGALGLVLNRPTGTGVDEVLVQPDDRAVGQVVRVVVRSGRQRVPRPDTGLHGTEAPFGPHVAAGRWSWSAVQANRSSADQLLTIDPTATSQRAARSQPLPCQSS